MASGSEDKTIKLWEVKTGKEIRTLQGHDSAVWSVSFSPDGQTVVSGHRDRTITLWNRETGKEILTFTGHDFPFTERQFQPRRPDWWLLAGQDKIIKFWNLPDLELDPLMGRNCDWVRDYLKNNPKVSRQDKDLCDGIGKQK